jgi:hypothetical protein
MEPSHRIKAKTLAKAMVAGKPDPDMPTAREVVIQLSATIPAGLYAAVELVSERTTRGNRSAAVSEMLALGHGLLLEQLTPEQRASWQEDLIARMADLVEGDE